MKKNMTLEEVAEARQKIIENWENSGLLNDLKAFDTTDKKTSDLIKLLQSSEKQVINESDCREEAGIAIGLIDGIIANLRVLHKHYQGVIKDDKSVQEALKDLKNDEDLAWLTKES